MRFINNARKSDTKVIGPLSVEELENTNTILIKLSQMESFSEELELLRKNKQLDAKHKFASLALFIDEKGIIRVGGRLKNTYSSFNIKHPILLSSKHNFTKLIFNHKHSQLLHPGPQLLLSSVRQFYWPVGGSILAKQTVRNCVNCFKFNPIPFSCPMSNLPNERIRPTLPFEVTGVDYAGPFYILNKPGKGAKLNKCYLAIFVCFCTKAIHCEIVTDLTSNNFLACLKRFVSRRGVPKIIYSDNGTTFHGTNNLLKDLSKFLFNNQASIVNSTSQYNIQWKFIPPYTPNHGGLWEAAVKSCKFHLKRALINNNVTYEEMCTLVIQIEGILNSRPLFAQSNDPNDLSPIKPSHFLIGRVLTSIPNIDYTNTNKYRLTRLEHIQKFYQQFWRRFSRQYISQLHQQYKWKDAPSTISVGTLVLIKTTLYPPCQWPMGIIRKLFPGRDGITRVAEVQTHKGLIIRSIRHLCPLPRQEDIDN
ncbi:uncharacterized protein LOC130897426 [Diorhabda carinulata]|uniref:uncharacterized protein LOC130897426 n=1 Tax=Diorhabda carinulata TaxID=1163345 RepID=UPI0025A0FF64|nr:uncharacterized protein LOC130897426 [Diorhabda carinulata]